MMSSIDVKINEINAAATTINVVVSSINFVLGAVGLVFNVLVFTRPPLRREPCSLYFFSSTCFNLFVIFVVIPVRILSGGFNIDMANYNLGICKIEFFAFYVTRTIPCWLIASACLDRYLHSSPRAHIRRLSSLKTAKLIIGIISVGITILYSHMIVYYEISNASNQFGNIALACNGQKGIYRTLIAFWYMILYSLCPSLLMFLFGCLTLNNLHQHHRRIVPRTLVINRIARRTEIQLLRMLAGQVLMIFITTLPFLVYRVYASFTASMAKDTLRIAQENLAFQCVGVMTYFAHSSSFYLYTLTGTVFRKEFFKIVSRCWAPTRNLVHIIRVETH